MPKNKTYTITTSDGKSHQVSKDNIEKYGWSAYADAYKGATVRMRDKDKADYDIPIEHYNDAVGQGLHPFTWEHNETQQQQPTKAAAQQQKPAKPAGTPMTKAERAQMMGDVDYMLSSTDSYLQRGQEQREAIADHYLHGGKQARSHEFSDRVLHGKKQQGIGNNSKVIPVYHKDGTKGFLTEAGNEYEFSGAADLEQNQLDIAKDKERSLRNQVETLSGDITNALNEHSGKTMGEYAENFHNGQPIVTTNEFDLGRMIFEGTSGEDVSKYNSLKAAQRSMQEAQRLIKEADHNSQSGTFGKWLESSFAGGAARGFGQKLFDANTWAFGVNDVKDASEMYAALKAFDEGKQLTKEQQMMLDAASVNLATQAYFSSRIGRGYKAGQVTAESLPFMLEMMINPASTVGSSVGSRVARYALKRFGKTAIRRNAKKFAATKIGARVLGDIAGASIMTATTGAARTAADALERHTGEVKYGMNSLGKIVYTGHKQGDSVVASIAKAFTANTIENYSELFGEYFAPMLDPVKHSIGKMLGKLATSKVGSKIGLQSVKKFINNASHSDLAQAVKGLEKRAQYHGVLGEYAEEVVGSAMNALLVGDESFTDRMNPDGTIQKSFLDLDNQIDTFLGVALMSGVLGTVKALGYRTPKYTARKAMNTADTEGSKIFGNSDAWELYKKRILSDNESDMKEAIAEISTSSDYTPEQKAAALNYANRALQYQGILKGDENRKGEMVQNIADGAATDEEKLKFDLEESYDEGSTLEDSEKNDALIRYEQARADLLGILEEDAEKAAERGYSPVSAEERLSNIDSNPLDELSILREHDDTNSTKANAPLEYVNAKAQYEGMMDATREKMDDAVEQSNAEVARRTHNDGMIHSATLKVKDEDGHDRKVYIIDGTVQMMDDGTMVDKEKSDKTILIYNEETGKKEFADIRDFLSVDNPIDAEQERQMAADAARRTVAQREGDLIDGVLPFNAGDQYNIIDAQGQPHTVQIVGDAVDQQGQPIDGSVAVIIDGQQQPTVMTKDQLQLGFNDAKRAAYVANKQQQQQQQEQDNKPATPEQQPQQIAATTFPFALNDEFTVQTADGQQRNGVVVEEANPDGLITIDFGDRVEQLTPEELQGLITEYNNEVVQQPQIKNTQEEVTVEGDGELTAAQSPTTSPSDNTKQTTEPQTPQQQTALSRIPTDENGEPMFEKASVKDTWEALVEMAAGNEETAIYTAQQMAKNASDALAKEAKKKPEAGKTPAQIIANVQAHQAAVDALQAQVNHWNNVAGFKEAEARRAEEHAKAEKRQRMADARKEQEKKGRYAEENKALGDYMDFRDYVMRTIATGGMRFKWSDDPNNPSVHGLASHLGMKGATKEMNKRIAFLSNDTGLYPEGAAHSLMESYAEALGLTEGYAEDIVNSQDALDVLLDVLASYDTPRAMFDAAVARHNEISEQEQAAEQYAQDYYEQQEAEAMGMSLDEWHDYKEAVAAQMQEMLNSASDEQLAQVFAEAEQAARDTYNHDQEIAQQLIQQAEDEINDNGTSTAGSNILPTEQSNIEGATTSSPTTGQRSNAGATGDSSSNVEQGAGGQLGIQGTSNERVSETPVGMSDEEAEEAMSLMEANAIETPQLELTPANWFEQFGNDGKVTTPVGEVKMGENQIAKLFEKGRSEQFGMIKPTLEKPLAVIEVPSEATDGQAERETSLLFVKTFIGKNGEKVYYFKSVTVKKDGMEVSVSSHYDRPKRIKEALKKGKLLYRFDGGAQTEHRPADVSVTASPEDVQGNEKFGSASEEQNGQSVADNTLQTENNSDSSDAPNGNVSKSSADKVTETSPTKQEKEKENYKLGNATVPVKDFYVLPPDKRGNREVIFKTNYLEAKIDADDNVSFYAVCMDEHAETQDRIVNEMEKRGYVTDLDGKKGHVIKFDNYEEAKKAADIVNELNTEEEYNKWKAQRQTLKTVGKTLTRAGVTEDGRPYKESLTVKSVTNGMADVELNTAGYGGPYQFTVEELAKELQSGGWKEEATAAIADAEQQAEQENDEEPIHSLWREMNKLHKQFQEERSMNVGLLEAAIDTQQRALDNLKEIQGRQEERKPATKRHGKGFSFMNPQKTTQELFEEEKAKFANDHNNRYADVIQSSSSVEEAIGKFHALAEKAKSEAEDWRKREYKKSGLKVEVKSDEDLDGHTEKSVQSINERRRANAIKNLEDTAAEYEEFAETLAKRTNYNTSTTDAITQAEQEVDTNPTEAQKEAGNYKKGHVKVDGYDISIEQPKGSVRTGHDADGNEWTNEIHNTYGYIRGTEGTDGDHIDVFLSDNPEQGNVYVIDQVNPKTGEFDEHKVMYGFNSMEEAKQAYLSNYSKGWKGLGTITEVSKDEFKKWIDSSHRKTKPFAEYKNVKANAAASNEATENKPLTAQEEKEIENDAAAKYADEMNNALNNGGIPNIGKLRGQIAQLGKRIKTIENGMAIGVSSDADMRKAQTALATLQGQQRAARAFLQMFNEKMENTAAASEGNNEANSQGYTIEARKDTRDNSDLYAVKFDARVSREEFKGQKEIAKKFGGYWSNFGKKGFLFKTEEAAQDFAETVMGRSKAEVEDEAPLSLKEIAEASDGKIVIGSPGLTPTGTVKEDEKGKAKSEQPKEQTKKEQPTDDPYHTAEERAKYEELKRRMRARLNQLNSGIDPDVLNIGLQMAYYHFKGGMRRFAEFCRAMIDDCGDKIRPHLKTLYNAFAGTEEAIEMGWDEEMDDRKTVRDFDVYNFDKEGPKDILATAEHIVKESKSQQQGESILDDFKEQRNEERKVKQEAIEAEAKRRGLKRGDKVLYKRNDGKEKWEEATITDFGGGADVTLDTGMAPVVYEAADFDQVKPMVKNSLGAIDGNYEEGEKVQTQAAEFSKVMEILQTDWEKEHVRKALRDAGYEYDDETFNALFEVSEDASWEFITQDEFEERVKELLANNKPSEPQSEEKPSMPEKGQEKPIQRDLFDDMETEPVLQKPADELQGDSEEYQQTANDEREFVVQVRNNIIEAVLKGKETGEVKPLTMADVRRLSAKFGTLRDYSTTDLQELVERAMTQVTRMYARDFLKTDDAAKQRKGYDEIVALYNAQPLLNTRDSTRSERQQFSTPTPFGYVMGQFIKAGKKVESVLEPSAGNGALTIDFDQRIVHVNDIDERRLANLRALGYGKVTSQNGLLPFIGEQVDAMLTNPPFGTTTEQLFDNGTFAINSLEGLMAINALNSMKDDGRAAIIIGGNTGYRENGVMMPKDMKFFGYLYSHYNVIDVINLDGKMYARNGTKYPVRIILIDGRKTGEFQRVIPPIKAKARAEQIHTFDELYKRVQDDIQLLQQRPQNWTVSGDGTTKAADGGHGTQSSSQSNTEHTGAGAKPIRIGGRSGGGRPTQLGGDATTSQPGERGGNERPAEHKPVNQLDNDNRTDAADTTNVQGHSATSGQRGEQHPSNTETKRNSGEQPSSQRTSVQTDTERGRLAVTLGQEKVPYPNRSQSGTLMSVVPATQAQVLADSLAKIGDVDQYLVDNLGYSSKEELFGYLAAEQIDSVALAIDQMSKGDGFIIGDMTGVGKGRQGAALIRYAVKQGYKPIYFTQKPSLFTDNYRDLCDIGSSNLRPFIVASSSDGVITDAQGNIVYKLPTKSETQRVMDYVSQYGTLPDEYDYALVTYSQIQSGIMDYEAKENGIVEKPKKYKGKIPAGDISGQKRRDLIEQLSRGNIMILDESHTVSGNSGQGGYMQMLLQRGTEADNAVAGVTFLSATFAKRPDNMPLYAMRTALSETGLPPEQMIGAIAQGGVTLQEIMSKQLVQSGQMIRRERSFEGVTIDWMQIDDKEDKKQRAAFNEVSSIFSAIRDFQANYIRTMVDKISDDIADTGSFSDIKRGTEALGVKNTPFASKMYNLVNQLLFALKADAVADRVIWNLQHGFKPVISFTNTMEGFLTEVPKDTPMEEVPNFSATLLRALDGVMRYQVTDADGNTTGSSFTLSQLPPEGQTEYNNIRKRILNLSANLSISPMDAIKMKIEAAGYTVGEITGRTTELTRGVDGKYIVRNRTDKDKKEAARQFNNGGIDVLMINKSGSTGISLHASPKFGDTRQRVMVFAQFQSDINDEVQMRGRIDRTGQKYRGRYEYIMSSIPAEMRLQMMFKAKLKSLDANTTSSQKSKFNEMEVVDFLNKYGDEVVWAYMKEHPELEDELGDPLNMFGSDEEDNSNQRNREEEKPKAGCAAKIARYLAFLPVERQEDVFKDITDTYSVKIQLLNDAGENDLEITTMPLNAETKSKKIWREGKAPNSGNAFADNTYLEEVEVDVLKKPMKATEVETYIQRLTGGKPFAEWKKEIADKIREYYRIKTSDLADKRNKAIEEKAAKTKEKYIKSATKARDGGKNDWTDEYIAHMGDLAAEEVKQDAVKKLQNQLKALDERRDYLLEYLDKFTPEQPLVIPLDLTSKDVSDTFLPSYGTFLGFKFNKEFSPTSSTAVFATLDGRRKVELPLSDEKSLRIILSSTLMHNYELRDINMDTWDSHVPTKTRKTAYIVTGNLLQALVDTEKRQNTKGYLISYSTIDGETRQGILMSDRFQPKDLRNSVPISARLDAVRDGEKVESEDGRVSIEKHRGWSNSGYWLYVPKSKQSGGIYFTDKTLRNLVFRNEFETHGNKMRAFVDADNIAKVLERLSKMGVTVLQESDLKSADDNVRFRLGDEPATFEERQRKAVESKGTVMPGLNEAEVKIVDVPRHEYKGTKVEAIKQAANDAIKKYNGKTLHYDNHGAKFDYSISGSSIKKSTNDSAIKKSDNPGVHTAVLNHLDRVISDSIEVEEHPDYLKGEDGVRRPENGNNPDIIVHRFMGAVVIDGKIYRVKTTIKEYRDPNEKAKTYTYEVTNVEVLDEKTPSTSNDAGYTNNGTFPLAKLLKGVEKSYEKGKKLLDESKKSLNGSTELNREDDEEAPTDERISYENDPIAKWLGEPWRTPKQRREYAAKERQRMEAKAKEMVEKLHIADSVEILTSTEGLKGKQAKAKGWYDVETGKIVIVVPNHVSRADVIKTVLHEGVAHYGLRKLFGENFDNFLHNVFYNAEPEIRAKIVEKMKKHGWDYKEATEEYLADLAQETDFESVNASWWNKIKTWFMQMLHSVGLAGAHFKEAITDNELRYILWRSYKNMTEPGHYRNLFAVAEDITMQNHLKVGNYAESTSTEKGMVADDDIRYRFIGEEGATNIDEAERTTRMRDNLKKARDLEAAYKELADKPEEQRRLQSAAKAVRELKAEKSENYPTTREQAEADYKAIGKAKNAQTGVEVEFFGSAFDKNHREGGLFEKAIPALKKTFENSVLIFSEADKRKGETRPDGSIHKEHRSVRSFDDYVGKVSIDGKEYYVRYTVQMQPGQNGVHSQFVTNVELYDTENPANIASYRDSSLPARLDVDRIVDAKLQRFFALASGNAHDFAKALKFATGWERGTDGKWRYEQPDGQMKDSVRDDYNNGRTDWTMEEFWDDPELFKAYPELKKMPVRIDGQKMLESGRLGEYDPDKKEIVLSNDIIEFGESNIFVHELQHAIQDIEGFASGGSDTSVRNAVNDHMTLYRQKLMNEIPQRIVEKVDEYRKKRSAYEDKRSEALQQMREANMEYGVDSQQYKEASALYNEMEQKIENEKPQEWYEYQDRLREIDQAVEAEGRRINQQIINNPRIYKYIAGEVEARNAENRMNMTDEERRQSLADETEDVARDEQILLRGEGKSYRSTIQSPGAGTARDYYEEKTRKSENVEGRKEKAKNLWWRLGKAYGDSMAALKAFTDGVLKETGGTMHSFEDAYKAENRLASSNKTQQEAWSRDYFKPIERIMTKLMDAGKSTYEDLKMYIVAKHGLERNEVLAQRDYNDYIAAAQKKLADYLQANPNSRATIAMFATKTLADFRKRDYSGLTALTNEKDVAKAEAAAQKIVDDYEQKHGKQLCDEWWGAINTATKSSLKKRYDSGLLSKAAYDHMCDMFKYYIPLKGWDSNVAADEYEYKSSSRGQIGSPSIKRAGGRTSLADDPVATIMSDGMKAIQQSNRNLMKRHFLNFVMNNPTSLASLARQWYVYNPTTDTWNVDEPVIPTDADGDQIAQIVQQHEADMQALYQQGLATYRKDHLKLGLNTTKAEQNEHKIKVLVGGIERIIYINGNPMVAQAINGVTNPDVNVGKVESFLLSVKNKMGAWFTSLYPAFVGANLSMDTIQAAAYTAIRENAAYNRQSLRNAALVFGKALMPQLVYKWEHGTLDTSNEVERYFDEFMRNGGETGFTQLLTVDKAKRDIERFLKEARGGLTTVPAKVWHNLTDAIEFLNRSAEDTNRFICYMTSRQQGRDVARSIWDAKEITVNFNKKGEGGMGARQMNFAYIFFNAAVQSLRGFGRVLGSNPKRAGAVISAFAGAGFIVPMLNAALVATCSALGGGGDDDDDPMQWYWDLPEWERRNNIVMYIPFSNGRFFKLPLPHELRGFYGIGECAFTAFNGKQTVGEALADAAMNFNTMLPLDFTGNGGNVVLNLTPTVGQPIVQVIANKDYFGKPIYRRSDYTALDPEWTKAYKGTSGLSIGISKFINSIGNEYPAEHKQPWDGAWDNPDVLEHLVGGYFGGAGKTWIQAYKTVSMAWDDNARDLRNIPIASRFVATATDERTGGSSTNSQYYDALDEYKQTEHDLSEFKKKAKAGVEGYADILSEFKQSDEYRRYEIVKKYNDVTSKLQGELKNIDNEDGAKAVSAVVNMLKRQMLETLQREKQAGYPEHEKGRDIMPDETERDLKRIERKLSRVTKARNRNEDGSHTDRVRQAEEDFIDEVKDFNQNDR